MHEPLFHLSFPISPLLYLFPIHLGMTNKSIFTFFRPVFHLNDKIYNNNREKNINITASINTDQFRQKISASHHGHKSASSALSLLGCELQFKHTLHRNRLVFVAKSACKRSTYTFDEHTFIMDKSHSN